MNNFPSLNPQESYDIDQQCVFHSWSPTTGRTPLNITAAQGSYVWNDKGDKILDLSSQLVNTNIGHQHPKVVQAIKDQADKICTIAPQHVNDQRSLAAQIILKYATDFSKVFFTNAGAEANEHAIRMAQNYTGRRKIASLFRSYHGSSGVAIKLTGDVRRWASDKGPSESVHFHGPFLYRTEFYSRTLEEETQRSLEHLDHLIAFEGPESFAAIILETIPGTAGIMVPPPGYLAGVRQICDKYGIVLIFDEVMAGFGRTGAWFAFDHWSVNPDLITFAKGVNSGYVPLGGVIVSEKIANYFADKPYPGGLTYSGHPLACAAAVATMTVMEEEKIIENAAHIGENVIKPYVEKIRINHISVGDVRGLGVFWALELVKDCNTKEPIAPYGKSSPVMIQLAAEALKKGVLLFHNYNRIHIVPPCTISAVEMEHGLSVIDEILTIADSHCQ